MSYAELHAKTNFSFLEGASHPDELVERAAELGYAALAVTDRNSLAGVVRAHGAAKDRGLKLIIGAEITPDDAPPVVLWAADRAAYGRLSRLITEGCRRAPKGECRLTLDDVARHSAGLLAGVLGKGEGRRGKGEDCKWKIGNCKFQTGEDIQSPIPNPQSLTLSPLHRYRDIFADRCYLLAELHYGPDDQRQLERLVELSRRCRLPLVAAGGVHYHIPERQALGDVLTAIRYGCTIFDAGERLFPNAQRYLRPIEEIRRLFARAPEAVRRTAEIAQRSTFTLDSLRYEYPEELAPPGEMPIEYLTCLTWAGARKRYPGGIPDKVRPLVEHELCLIAELGYEAYFLTVWDLVRFARSRGILCQGRGSAANSAVCFCLGITSVDPERMDVLFERFVSRERNEAPDIDVDFEHERREEVLQYLYGKYGRERAGMTAEVITYRPRSAVRDVGKALGMSLAQVDRLAKQMEHFHEEPDLPARCREAGIDLESTQGRQFVELVPQLVGFPRHLSQHTGGMVMTRGPLCELVPIENAAMPDRTVIQWNKDDLDELGILKVDCLSLGMLTAIRKCFALMERHYDLPLPPGATSGVVPGSEGKEVSAGVAAPPHPGHHGTWSLSQRERGAARLTLADIPEGDPDVYAMIRRADTMGVFQIESRAQMSMLPRLRPACFYDLVIEVAIVRPGPIQGNMVHPYLRRRNGEEPVAFPNEVVRRVLEKTLGVPLFQEQAMRLAVEAAGFTPGEADQLRRAMGAWRRPGLIDQFRKKLVEGMLGRGFSREYADSVFHQIRGFGDYGFPESHAASFALLVYVSAWLKHHYPAAFTAAMLNSQPLGFYAPAQLVRNVQEHGVTVLPVDVNHSRWDCTLEGDCKLKIDNWKLKIANCKLQIEETAARREEPSPQTQLSISNFQFPICNSSFPILSSPLSLRLGFRMLTGLSQQHAERIVEARGEEPFRSIEDFAQRAGLSRAVLVRLAKAGVFGSLGLGRREALWHALEQDQRALPLFEGRREERRGRRDCKLKIEKCKLKSEEGAPTRREEPAPRTQFALLNFQFPISSLPPSVPLPALSPAEEVLADYRTTGMSLRGHPLQFLRTELDRLGAVPAAALKTWPNGKPVRVAGLVLVRQRPGTAKGITFVTLEDETGTANLIIRLGVWRRFRSAALGATILLARGPLQRQGEVIHVIATRLDDLSARFREMTSQSRDFC